MIEGNRRVDELMAWEKNHPGEMNAIGNKKSGFVYEVEWWDTKFKRTLECATKEYTDATRKAVVELAKK